MPLTKSQQKEFEQKAVTLAKEALYKNEFPVGAVLVIDAKEVDALHNTLITNQSWSDHAELRLLVKHSQTIRKAKNLGKEVHLFTSLEPCLMCLATASHHRVNSITFSCADPSGGVSNFSIKKLPYFYQKHWPIILSGVLQKSSLQLVQSFLEKQTSAGYIEMKKLFSKIEK